MTNPVSGGVPEPQGTLNRRLKRIADEMPALRDFIRVEHGPIGWEHTLSIWVTDLQKIGAALERPRPTLPAEPEREFCHRFMQALGFGPGGMLDSIDAIAEFHREAVQIAGEAAALPPQTGNPPPQRGSDSPHDTETLGDFWRGDVKLTDDERHWVRTALDVLEQEGGVSSLRAPQSGPWPFAGEFPAMSDEELLLRKLLWLRHHDTTVGLYGDDGEMQCSKCMLDFRRMSAREIEKRWFDIGMQKLAGSGAETPPQPEIPK